MNIKKISVSVILAVVMIAFGAVLAIGTAKAATVAPQINRDLGLGLTGEDVRSLQQFLNGNGYLVAASGAGSPGRETIYFGNATKAALARFQAAHGISATGYFNSATRGLFSGMQTGITGYTGNYNANLLTRIELLRRQIILLQQQLEALLHGSAAGNPYISSIAVSNGGDSGYIDTGDTITVTFSEAVDPRSINSSLYSGNYVSGVSSSQTGGVNITSAGLMTVKGIASFDTGTVSRSENFTVKLALSSSDKVLIINLTGGDDVSIISENFTGTAQIGGTIKDQGGNFMNGDSNIGKPVGTFGGNGSGNAGPDIVSIKVSDGGDSGYIDTGDSIKITFNEVIDPDSINRNLDEGGYVSGIFASETGGFSLSSAGRVTINGIAAFDMGTVSVSGTFTSKVALDPTGKILTITLTNGSDFKIDREDFGSAEQVGGVVEDLDGNEMKSDSSIDDPAGTFGGDTGSSPYIVSVTAADGGDQDYIDTGDSIAILFSEAINPKSINNSLGNGGNITGIEPSMIGGARITSAGIVNIEGIAFFDMGTVSVSGAFTSKIALSSNGRTLTITLTEGGDIPISSEDFGSVSQVGGAVEDLNGNTMEGDSDIDRKPSGTFGGDDNDDDVLPYITSINVSNGSDRYHVDSGDYITVAFSEAVDPRSINGGLDEGTYVTGVDASEIGGVSVASAGLVTIDGIATFDVGAVDSSEDYTAKLALSSNGRTLTITLTGGSDVEITDENFQAASQTGGIVKDRNGNGMDILSNAIEPSGNF